MGVILETIDYEDLDFIDKDAYNNGSYGEIKRCILDGKKYVCKSFFNEEYLNGKKRKLNLLGDIDKPGLYVPKFWVKKQESKNMYLTEYFSGNNGEFLCDEPYKIKIEKIKNIKQLMLSMHQEGIIHADLIPSNILYFKDDCAIIDFDNSSYKNYKTNINHTNDYSKEFITKYGLTPEIDIFLFNLLTYYWLNELNNFYMVRNKIRSNNYGVFNDSYERKICNSLLLESDVPNQDFLIDTIDETSLKV